MVTVAKRGYTILEMALVIFIIGVFGVMIAIGAFQVLDSESEKLAHVHAQAVAMDEQRFAQQYGTYTGFPADLPDADGYVVVTGESADHTQVSVALGANGNLGIAVRRDDDNCFHYQVTDLAAGGGSVPVKLGASAICSGEEALPSGEARAEGSATASAAW